MYQYTIGGWTHWGSAFAPPDALATMRGPTSKAGRRGDRRGAELRGCGRERKGRDGKCGPPSHQNPDMPMKTVDGNHHRSLPRILLT